MRMLRLTKELMEDLANRPQCPECGSHFVVTVNSRVSKLTCVKCAYVVLLPMLNTNSDLVILKNRPLGFLFTVIPLTPSLKFSIFLSPPFKSGLRKPVKKLKKIHSQTSNTKERRQSKSYKYR